MDHVVVRCAQPPSIYIYISIIVRINYAFFINRLGFVYTNSYRPKLTAYFMAGNIIRFIVASNHYVICDTCFHEPIAQHPSRSPLAITGGEPTFGNKLPVRLARSRSDCASIVPFHFIGLEMAPKRLNLNYKLVQ